MEAGKTDGTKSNWKRIRQRNDVDLNKGPRQVGLDARYV